MTIKKDISKLREHPENPQTYTREDLEKLKESIRKFPKMMSLRPIIYDPDTNYVLAGNKRLICLKEMGYTEVPAEWLKDASSLDEDEKRRLILQDNMQAGRWDEEVLKEFWDFELLDEVGLEIQDFEPGETFEDEFMAVTDKDAEMPIVPDGDEKYTFFVIFTKSRAEEEVVRRLFDLNRHYASRKKTDHRMSAVIPIENIYRLEKKCR